MKKLFFFLVVSFFLSCASSNKGSTGYVSDQNTMTLLDHIHSLPGVTVNGDGSNAKIRVRGVNSFTNNSPLFIIDGNDMGYDFASVNNLVSANNIKRVKLFKEPSETGIYGVRGANGVIVIRTTGTNDAFGK